CRKQAVPAAFAVLLGRRVEEMILSANLVPGLLPGLPGSRAKGDDPGANRYPNPSWRATGRPLFPPPPPPAQVTGLPSIAFSAPAPQGALSFAGGRDTLAAASPPPT